MGRSRKGYRGASRPRRVKTQWFGIQFEEVALAADPGFNAFVILTDDSVPGRRGTVIRTVGKITLSKSDVDKAVSSTIVMAKVMPLVTNDAGAVVQDVFPFDNDVDDMGVRQMWTGSWTLPIANAAANDPTVDIEIDIKVKASIKTKWLLALIMGADVVDQVLATGYIRTLVALP